MDCRLSSLDFDIAASAGWYSAIAGLLAGFALLSILLPLDHEAADPDEAQSGNAVVVFTCAFVSLLALGFAFAVLAGRTGDGDVIGLAAVGAVLSGESAHQVHPSRVSISDDRLRLWVVPTSRAG